MNRQAKTPTKPKPLKPIYLIYGDKKMIDEALTRLKKRISAQFDLDFNYDKLSGAQVGAVQILQAANTLPFMSDKRLIIIKDADKLSSEDTSLIAKYAENPSETTCLVFVADTVQKSSRLYKAIDKHGEIAEYKLKESPLVWIKREFSARGKLVSDSVARHLLNMVGSDLQRLSVEIEKVSLFCNDDKIIDPIDIEAVLVKSIEASVFDLIDRIGERKVMSTLDILAAILQQKEAPLAILSLIVRHFRLLLRTKVWIEEGHDNKYLIEHLTGAEGKKLPYFVIAKLREQSHNFSTGELVKIFNHLIEADIALKSSPQPPEVIMEDLVVRLAV